MHGIFVEKTIKWVKKKNCKIYSHIKALLHSSFEATDLDRYMMASHSNEGSSAWHICKKNTKKAGEKIAKFTST